MIGELVDAWDEEDANQRAATLARQGFLPELTPAFPGVTAPIPQVCCDTNVNISAIFN
jgi:hypothetical protein